MRRRVRSACMRPPGHELGGQLLDLLGERGGEHERLALARLRHVLALDDAADLRRQKRARSTRASGAREARVRRVLSEGCV
eukprot:6187709-Pleurochrysis_carterae.AAC.7